MTPSNMKFIHFAVSYLITKLLLAALFASIVDLGQLHFLEDRFAFILPLLNIHNLGYVDFVQLALYVIEILIFCFLFKNLVREISDKSAWFFSVLLFISPAVLKLVTHVFYGNGFQQLATELSYFSQNIGSMLTSILISSAYVYTSYIYLILHKPLKKPSNQIFFLPVKYWFLIIIPIFGYSFFLFRFLVVTIFYYYQLLIKFDFTERMWWINLSVFTVIEFYIIIFYLGFIDIVFDSMSSEKEIKKNTKPIIIFGIILPVIIFLTGDKIIDVISAILNAIIN
ncbi:MAG: hypothetical protein RL164_112 [Bacteroidota bacterium]